MKGTLFMSIIKLPFKIIAAPLVVILTIAVAVLTFLFCWAKTFLEIISGIGVLLSIVLFFIGQKLGCCVFLILSFLISPLGIPAIADWLIDKVDDLNYSLRYFIMS